MKRWNLVCAAVAAVALSAGCGVKEIGDGPETGGGPDRGENGGQEELPDERSVYVTGVEYAEGYDWIKDPDYGTVRCVIFLERDGTRILEVPAGYAYETSPDPDMHRCAGGHLYTDYSTSHDTVVKKDGEELFRFEGREMLVSFVADGDNVYTAGMDRGGAPGFTFRRNGVELFRSSGSLLTGICMQGGKPCFAYSEETAGQGSEDSHVLYVWQDGVSEQYASCRTGFIDAGFSGGSLCYLTGGDAVEMPVPSFHYPGKQAVSIVSDHGCPLLWTRVVQGGGTAYVTACFTDADGGYRYAAWDAGGKLFETDLYDPPVYSFIDGGRLYDMVSGQEQFSAAESYADGEYLFSYGTSRAFQGTSCAAVAGGSLYCILSDMLPPRIPYLAVDGSVEKGGFNGYYTGVTSW